MSSESFEVNVRLTPKSSRDRLELQQDGSLKVWVTSAPTDNQANENLCQFLAKQLRIGKTNIEIISGHTNRSKRVRISGLDRDGFLRSFDQ